MGTWRDMWGHAVAGGATLFAFAGAPLLGAMWATPMAELDALDEPVPAAVYLPDTWLEPETVSVALLEPEPEPDPVTAVESEAEASPSEAPEDAKPADLELAVVPAEEDADLAAAEEDAEPTRKRRRKRRRCKIEPIPEIARTSTVAWTVDREIVQTYARSIKKLNTLGWSRPHEGDDGKRDGLQIGGVRCNNDLYRAGIRSGDVVHSVNGHRIRNLLQAVFVYGKVRKDPLVRVEITRRGKRKVLTYRILG